MSLFLAKFLEKIIKKALIFSINLFSHTNKAGISQSQKVHCSMLNIDVQL